MHVSDCIVDMHITINMYINMGGAIYPFFLSQGRAPGVIFHPVFRWTAAAAADAAAALTAAAALMVLARASEGCPLRRKGKTLEPPYATAPILRSGRAGWGVDYMSRNTINEVCNTNLFASICF